MIKEKVEKCPKCGGNLRLSVIGQEHETYVCENYYHGCNFLKRIKIR